MNTLTLEQQIEQLKAENEALKAGKKEVKKLTMKVSEKGALSIYGLGRFPVTLYKEQWLKLLAHVEAITSFIKDNEESLKTKE